MSSQQRGHILTLNAMTRSPVGFNLSHFCTFLSIFCSSVCLATKFLPFSAWPVPFSGWVRHLPSCSQRPMSLLWLTTACLSLSLQTASPWGSDKCLLNEWIELCPAPTRWTNSPWNVKTVGLGARKEVLYYTGSKVLAPWVAWRKIRIKSKKVLTTLRNNKLG